MYAFVGQSNQGSQRKKLQNQQASMPYVPCRNFPEVSTRTHIDPSDPAPAGRGRTRSVNLADVTISLWCSVSEKSLTISDVVGILVLQADDPRTWTS
jgi:hypothetical protein